jgi:hypothetical protein
LSYAHRESSRQWFEDQIRIHDGGFWVEDILPPSKTLGARQFMRSRHTSSVR